MDTLLSAEKSLANATPDGNERMRALRNEGHAREGWGFVARQTGRIFAVGDAFALDLWGKVGEDLKTIQLGRNTSHGTAEVSARG